MTENNIGGMSPLEAVTSDRFKGKTYPNEFTMTIDVTLTPILPNNPNRLFWIITNEGANDCRVSIDPAISATSGWILAAAGGLISMFWEEDGEGVGYAVYGICVAAGAKIRVREVIRS